MAKLIKCSDCEKDISKKAKTCPNCGARNKKKAGIGTWILLGFVAMIFISGLQKSDDLIQNAQQSAASGTYNNATPSGGTNTEDRQASWHYTHDNDPMSKGVTHTAILQSSNTVSFGFPYAGPQRATLVLRTHPKHGKDVIFSIEKGQLLCTSYDGCTVQVRFDDQDSAGFSAIGAADNSTDTLFIQNYSRFVEKMMKAKRVRISANVYQEGSPVFEFDVSGFNKSSYLPE